MEESYQIGRQLTSAGTMEARYQLYNQTTKQVVHSRLFQAKTTLQQLRGLVGYPPHQALYLNTRLGLHSLGMTYPLTILICDNQLCVKKISLLRPWHWLFFSPFWQHIFELPKAGYRVKIGDRLQILEASE